MRWYEKAACRGMDVRLWFPDRGEDYGRALSVCRTCEVVQPCLESAVREERGVHYRVGMRGGLTPWERRAL